MIIPKETIINVIEEVIHEFLLPKFDALEMNATGEWLDSLEARADFNKGEIWGKHYTRYLVNGRAPGKKPPITPILNWVTHKFGIPPGEEAKSIAFAVANKIANVGTSYYPNGTDLLEVLQSKDVQELVNQKIANFLIENLKLNIIRKAKEIVSK